MGGGKDLLKSLWIISNNGLCVYHANFTQVKKQDEVSEDLFSGFVSAIFSMSSSMDGEELQSVTMRGSKLHYLVGKDRTIYSASVEKKARDSQIKDMLQAVENAYNRLFPEEDSLMDTDDPRFSQLDEEISEFVNQRLSSVRSPRGKKIEEALRLALRGSASIEETIHLVDSEIAKGLSNRDRNVIKALLNDLTSVSTFLNLDPEVVSRLNELREKLSTWIDKAKVAVTKGW